MQSWRHVDAIAPIVRRSGKTDSKQMQRGIRFRPDESQLECCEPEDAARTDRERYRSNNTTAKIGVDSRSATLPFPESAIAAILQGARKRLIWLCVVMETIRMRYLSKAAVFLGLLALAMATSAQAADEFKLGNNQRIACGRGLSPGRLNTATCRSYAYVFNTRTSEYFRCTVNLAITRNNKEILNVQTDGGCVKKPRVFPDDGSYSFEATETEPPNTNSFFGQGGYAIWASDNTSQKIRGCITISPGLGADITKCLDMTFE
jgi:hypothetical protein